MTSHWSFRYVEFTVKNIVYWASLVAQWLRICLLMQGTRVQALVWEDPTCRGATGPVSHNHWACASGACAPATREAAIVRGPCTAMKRVAPACHSQRQPSHRIEDLKHSHKKKKKKYIYIYIVYFIIICNCMLHISYTSIIYNKHVKIHTHTHTQVLPEIWLLNIHQLITAYNPWSRDGKVI